MSFRPTNTFNLCQLPIGIMESNKDEESTKMGCTDSFNGHASEHLTVAVPKTAQVMWSGESLMGHSPQQTTATCFLPEDSMESSMYMMRPTKRRHIQDPVDSACRVMGSCSTVLVWLLSSRTIIEEYPQSSLVEACEAYAARHKHTYNTRFKLVLIEDVQVGVEEGKLTVRILGELVRDLPAAVLVRVPTPTVQSDSELTVLRHLELMGMRLINPSRGIFDCANKFWTFQRLAGHGIPLPNTLSYGGLATKVPAVAEQLEKSGAVQFPAVMKNVRGHRGKNVWLGKTRQEVVTDIQGMPQNAAPYLFQHYVKESHGKDVRVIVIGDQVFGAMYRQAPDDRLCSNCSQGGSGTPFNLPEDAKAMCVRIAKILKMDIIGIDLLFQGGSFVLCEANPNVGYKAFDKCYNISVGASIAEYAFGRAMENLHVMAPHIRIEGSIGNVATVVPLPAALPPVAVPPV